MNEAQLAAVVALGESVFATLPNVLGPTTFGLTSKRKHRQITP